MSKSYITLCIIFLVINPRRSNVIRTENHEMFSEINISINFRVHFEDLGVLT